jgi:molybdate transport system substrate-binding protein
MINLRGALLCLLSLAGLPVQADEINIAVAANFLGTLQQLAPKFEQASGHHLVISSGASGQLYTQIKQGAPFDVLLSADAERPKLLETEGLGIASTRFTYAIGTLVLWSAKPGVVDVDGDVLHRGQFRALAIADPKSAPYGAAAQQVLTAMGLWESLNNDHKLVVGENINQTWQFAASGNADLAFVALSQVNSVQADNKAGSGSSWLPPQSQYTRIDQDAIVIARTTKRAAADSFMQWLRHDSQALAIIKAAGYRVGE